MAVEDTQENSDKCIYGDCPSYPGNEPWLKRGEVQVRLVPELPRRWRQGPLLRNGQEFTGNHAERMHVSHLRSIHGEQPQ